jgi:hypothetical protein
VSNNLIQSSNNAGDGMKEDVANRLRAGDEESGHLIGKVCWPTNTGIAEPPAS